MKKVRHGKLFTIVMLLLVLMGSLLNFQTVWATETSETAVSSEEIQSGKVTKKSNVTKKVTKKNANVTMETDCGIDGFAAYDNPVAVAITVSYNKDFTGSIRMTPSAEEGQVVIAYGQDISLAKGEAKTFSFTPTVLGSSGKIKVQLLDDNEKVIYEETDTVSLNSIGTNVMVGILSDDYSGLNYFDGVPIVLGSYKGTISTLELTTESFPDSKEALSILNYILIDNYDTANLSEEQYTALKEWVNDGGVLMLSLGANYQNVLHKFTDEFVTGTLGSMDKKQLEWVISEAELSLADVDFVEFVLDNGEELEQFSTDKTVYKKKIGLGAAVVLSYDLGMEPMASYEYKKEVAAALVQAAAVSEVTKRLNGTSSNNMSAMGSGLDVAKKMNDTKKPSTALFGLILGIYIVLVGPVLYLVLKKMKKREKIWLAVPLVSLLFTGIIYVTGLMYRVNKPIVNTFSVISLEGESKEEKVFTAITCPKAKEYRFKLNDKYKNFNSYTNNYSYSVFGMDKNSDSVDYILKKENDGMELIANAGSAFTDAEFYVNTTGKNDMGTLDTDLHFYTDGFEGTITNNTNYDLENVVVNFENHYYRAGDMKKGEMVTINKTNLVEAYDYGTFDYIYNINAQLYSDKELYKNYQIDSFMDTTYVDLDTYNQGCIWAGIGSYKPEVVDSNSGETYGEGVVFTTFTGDYEDVTGVYYPNINEMMMSCDGDFSTTDGMIYTNNVTVTYSFENITELINQSYGKTPLDYVYESYADVYAYNIADGKYEQIFQDSDTIGGEELKKYISGNILILRYETNGSDMAIMPQIAAKGEE